jgi:uncharacterized membrane protein YraQ (UPF0718 family)
LSEDGYFGRSPSGDGRGDRVSINLIYLHMTNERKENILSESGKFLIDISKLVFGGIILAGIMKFETINTTLLYSMGGASVLVCFVAGLILTTLAKKGN